MEPSFTGTPLTSFRPATLEEIVMLVNQSKSKTCPLDPLPTTLLKQCTQEFAPSLLTVINQCFSQEHPPDYFKHALVTPLLKKPDLNQNDLKNGAVLS